MEYESGENEELAELEKYPRWDEGEVKLLWHKIWFDGPINGLVDYRGARYWFDFWCDTAEPGNPFYYFAYPLSVAEVEALEAWRALEVELKRAWSATLSDEAFEAWSGHGKTFPEVTRRTPVGWFWSHYNPGFQAIHVVKAPTPNDSGTLEAE